MYTPISYLSISTMPINKTTARFPLLHEPLALDLANTRIRRDGVDIDLLDSPAALDRWLQAERERVVWMGAAGEEDLAAVRNFRELIDQLLHAWHVRQPPSAEVLSAFNAVLTHTAAPSLLAWGDAEPQLGPTPHQSPRDVLLRQLATDLLELLLGQDASRLRRCANADCRLQFVAINPRRRWCSSALCGNRARVARHYRRHQAQR